jgi:L-aminopeptidase/D-esterase-like protein
MRRPAVAAGFGALLALSGPCRAGGQDDLAINTEITGPVLNLDWPAVEIGVASYEAGPTGITVFHFPKRASGAVDARGGAPGTILADLLRAGYQEAFIDGIGLAGGAPYGLEAIAGTMTALKDDGAKDGRWTNTAIIPGAIIYDFDGHRLNDIYPDRRLGQAAVRALRPGVFPLGAQGAGRMPMQGWFFGCAAHSGQGGAFRQIGDTKIAAFAVVNANGAVTDRDGNLVKCNRGLNWGALSKTSELINRVPESRDRDWAPPAANGDAPTRRNTTISLVITNRKMGWAGLQRLATQVHSSMARAIQPFATYDDGDTLYAVSTQEVEATTPGLMNLDTVAGEVMWDAILASVPDEPVFTPPTAPVTVAPATLARYARTYRFGPHALVAVEAADGNLTATLRDTGFFDLRKDQKMPLLALSDTAFYIDGRYHTRLSFTVDAAGTVTGATVNPGKWAQAGTREP